jgi:thiosulfate/3-mercaptopyruvate sulfurtransferase
MALVPTMRVLQPDVAASLGQPSIRLLDARTEAEYRGEVFLNRPPQAGERGGHLPGAVHVEHTLTLNQDGTFKSPQELADLFTSKGLTPDNTIFPYCAIGGRSAYMWFVLTQLLGYPHVRNYDGSWNQWGHLSDVPIEQ